MSEHKNIAAALAEAQRKMGKALKESQNPHFRSKYADLGNVMDACMPALNEAGIAVFQTMRENEFGRSMVTCFLHSSGESLECPVPLIVGKNDMQGLGSAVTYARRYGLMSLAGIAPEDDDGNAAVSSQTFRPRDKSWAQTVINELPDDATEHDKARAVADAIIANFKRKKTPGELSNEWDRRATLIRTYEDRFKPMHSEIVDAYENRMIEIAPKDQNVTAE